jgi:hypothetical protein
MEKYENTRSSIVDVGDYSAIRDEVRTVAFGFHATNDGIYDDSEGGSSGNLPSFSRKDSAFHELMDSYAPSTEAKARKILNSNRRIKGKANVKFLDNYDEVFRFYDELIDAVEDRPVSVMEAKFIPLSYKEENTGLTVTIDSYTSGGKYGKIVKKVPPFLIRGTSKLHTLNSPYLWNDSPVIDYFFSEWLNGFKEDLKKLTESGMARLATFEEDKLNSIVDLSRVPCSYHPYMKEKYVSNEKKYNINKFHILDELFDDFLRDNSYNESITQLKSNSKVMSLPRGTMLGSTVPVSGADKNANAIGLMVTAALGIYGRNDSKFFHELYSRLDDNYAKHGFADFSNVSLQGTRDQRKSGSRSIFVRDSLGFSELGKIEGAVMKKRMIVISPRELKAYAQPVVKLMDMFTSDYLSFVVLSPKDGYDLMMEAKVNEEEWELVSSDFSKFDENANYSFLSKIDGLYKKAFGEMKISFSGYKYLQNNRQLIPDLFGAGSLLAEHSRTKVDSGSPTTTVDGRLYVAILMIQVLGDLGMSDKRIKELLKKGYNDFMFLMDFGDDLQIGIKKNNELNITHDKIFSHAIEVYGASISPEAAFGHLAHCFMDNNLKPVPSVASLVGSMLFPERPKSDKTIILLATLSRLMMLQESPLLDNFITIANIHHEFLGIKKVDKESYKMIFDKEFQDEVAKAVKKSVNAAEQVNNLIERLSHGDNSKLPEDLDMLIPYQKQATLSMERWNRKDRHR